MDKAQTIKNRKAKKNKESFEEEEENEEEIKSNEPTLYDLLNVSKNATTEEIVFSNMYSN